MAKPTHEGSYILKIAASGVSTTRENQCPQFIFSGDLLKRYDEEKGEYEPWDEYDQQANGYLVLVDTKGNDLFNIENIGKALGWDGTSFAELGATDYVDQEILVRIAENEYNDKITLQVQSIDNKDADPIVGLRVMNAEELADLDKQYKRNKTKPQSTRNTPPVKGAKTPPKNPSTKGRKATPSKPPEVKGNTPPKNTTTKGPKESPIPPKQREVDVVNGEDHVRPPVESVEETTDQRKKVTNKTDCWKAVNEAKDDKYDDDALLQAWDDGIAAVGPEEGYDGDDWDSLYEFVVSTIGSF